MANENAFNRVRNAWLRGSSHKQVARDQSRAKIAYRAQQDALDDVSGCLRGIACSPRQYWPRESPAFPPMGIPAGDMQNRFITADAFALAGPIRGNQRTLATCCASFKELQMLTVQLSAKRPVIGIVVVDSLAFRKLVLKFQQT